MSASVYTKHLHISKDGAPGPCEVCGHGYGHDNHKEALGKNSIDLHHLEEDARIDVIASKVREGNVVGVLLEFGIGKVERYIRKLADRHPDVRLIDRVWGPSKLVETVRFGPRLQG